MNTSLIRWGSVLAVLSLALAGCPGEKPVPPPPEPPPALVLPDVSLAETTVGLPYSASLQASGGKGALTHSATGLPAGLTLAPADGAISGSATESGDFTVVLTVTDEADQTGTKDFPLSVAAAPAFTTTSIPGATAGSEYVATFTVTGGKAPVVIAVESGELAPGLTFDGPTATLSGAATAPGTFTFTLGAVDAHGAKITQAFTLEVAPPLELITTSLPNGNVGVAYSQTLKAKGGKDPLTWEIAQGMLPDGLMLEGATGKLTGTPLSGGPFQLTFAVRDANGASLPLEIDAAIFGNAPPQVATTMLPNAVVGLAYSHNLVASEGAPPYAWTVSSGALPAGLTLSSAGVISGVATTAGPQSFQLTVTDANGQSAQKALTLTVYTELVIATAGLNESYTGQAYSQTLSATGGQPPYTWTVAGGALPAGITLTSTGILSGTPTQSGSYGVTISVADTSGQAPTKPFTLTLFDLPQLTTTSLANAVVGTNYSQPLTTSGGKAPFSFAITAGSLPSGIQLIGNTLSGTPTAAGTSTFVITATDANLKTDSKTLNLTVFQTLAVTTGTLPEPYVGTSYNQTLTAAGGAPPYTWTVTNGTLPAGLTLGANGAITGTPTAAGNSTFTVQVQAANGATATQTFSVTVRSAPALSTTSLPDGYVNEAYSLTLTATGGKTPFTFSVSQGALPAGLTLSSTGVLSGTPTAAGSSTVTLAVTDANNVAGTATFTFGVFTLPAIGTAAIADGYVGSGYSQTLSSTGGKAPLTWSLFSGVLPAGLSLGASTGAISGTPTTTGTAVFTARVTDANGKLANAPLSLAVFVAPTIASTSLPDGTLNTAYSSAVVANGGKAPLTWTVSSGALPSGLTLAGNGVVSGTPTAAGTSTFALTVTDANNVSAAATFSIVVYASLTVSTASPLPDAYQQAPYSQALQAAGGKSPYSWAVTAGSLPAGLNLSTAGTLSGTPTAAVSAGSFTVTVTDFNGLSASKAFALTVTGTPAITATTLGDGYVGLPYSATVTAQKGKLPYTFTVSSGALPAGISLDASSGELSGAPSANGTSTFEITLTDANALTNKKTFVVGIYDAPQVSTPSPLADAYAGSAYQVTLAGTGGKTPYTWSVVSGMLPAGLSLDASGDLSGTPTAAGAASFSARLTDANGQVATRSYTLTVRAPLAITTAALGDGYAGTAYPSTSLAASGGKAPYSFAVTGGALPAGLTLASSGALTGTPTAAGSSTFTVTVTDANAVTATKSFTLAVFAAPAITTGSPLPDAYAATAYSQTLAISGGKAPLTSALSAGALPPGLTLSTAGVVSGTTSTTGSFSFTVTVTDDNGVSGSKPFSLAVLSTLQLTTTTLADGYVGDAYAATLSASGGKSPYSFAVTSGTLPAGLSLTGATLSGTPTAASASTFTVTVTDANGKTAAQSLTANVFAKPAVSTATLADAYVGSAYSASLAASGGKAPFTWAVTSGALPSGVSLSPSGALSGTPTATGSNAFTVTLTDANGQTASKPLTLAVLQALAITTAALPDGYSGSAYSASLAAAGGKTPYSFAVQTGTLPAGLTLSSAGALSGTPTATGTSTVTFSVTDANGVSATRAVALEVLAAPSITTATLVDGYPSTAYSDALTATGGRAPYTFSAASGLPPGVTLSSTGAFGGTPTTPGVYTFTATVTDANTKAGTKSLVITVRSALVVSTASLADGYVGNAYSATLAATGGKTPYSWSVGSGALPAGVSLAASTGVLSGTPTAASTSSFTVRVTDANGAFTDQALALTTFEKPAVSTASPLPDAYVSNAYSQTLAATGGKAPLTWALSAGTLPSGLTLSPAGVLSGTATANGTSSFTARVTDANGQQGTKAMTLTVLSGFFVTTASLPDGYTGTAYSQTLAASGGLPPYTWSTTSSLPAGITLSSAGVLSGTPTAAGTSSLNIVATDSNSVTTTKALTIVVRTPPAITTASLPDAYVGSAYNQTLAGSGGLAPYTWSVAPALSAGLTLASSGALSGTPTAAKTQTAYTFTLTDANGVSATKAINLTVYAAPAVTVPTPPDAYVGLAYSLAPSVTGGKAPIAWSTTGTVPAWATVNASTGAITGSPTASGSVSFTVVATDANTQSGSAPVAFTVYAMPSVSTASLPTPYVSVAYSATLAATGGKAPLTWSISSGALPTGVSLNASTGALSGTPTAAGTFTFATTVTDANGKTANKSFTLTVPAALSITTASLADAYRNVAYSGTLAATGGLAPYTFSLSSGSLPAGLTLASGGAISGTASSTAATQSFVVLVTDANGTTASKSLGITVFDAPAISTASVADGYVGTAYAQTLTTTGGKTPLTFSVSAGALPAGVTLNASTGALSGTPTASGTANFTLTVSDANGRTGSKALSLAVFASPTIAAATFQPGYAGNSYTKTLSVTGGKGPFTWSITQGALPPGLTIGASTGTVGSAISATGITNGQTFSFTVSVVDANAKVASQAFTLVVQLPPTISTSALTTGTEGVTYMKSPGVSEQLTAQNGKTPYTWTIGGLPPGLTASSATGVISGTPAQGSAGTHPISVSLADANGFSVTAPALSLQVVAPTLIAGGGTRSVAPAGSPITNEVTIFVANSDDVPKANVGVRLRKNGVEYSPVKQALTNANGKVWFSGLGLNGTTDTLDITVNGMDLPNVTFAKVNAALVTIPVESYPLPGKRDRPAAAWDSATNQLVVFGGLGNGVPGSPTGAECPNNTVRLSPTGASWTESIVPGLSASPQPRYGAAMIATGGSALLVGGALCAGGNLNDAWLYNLSSNSWTPTSGIPGSPRSESALAHAMGGQVVLYGGNSFGPTNEAFIWNGGSWSMLSSPPVPPRYRAAGAYRSAANESWFCGGFNSAALSDCVAYGGGFGFWMPKPSLPAARDGLAMAYDPSADILYAFGGRDSAQVPSNDLFRAVAGNWSPAMVSGTKPPARWGHAMAWDAANSRLVIYGGNGVSGALDDVWTFSPASGTWTRQSPAPVTPSTFTLSGAITGGYAAPGEPSSAVVTVTTSSGRVLTATVGLSLTGSGSYSIGGIPSGDTVTLIAVNQVFGGPPPKDYYSIADLGTLGPITANTTQNVAFPMGPMTRTTSSGTFAVPADWSPTTAVQLSPMASRTGYPIRSLTNGTASPSGGAFTASYLPVGSGTSQDLVLSGQDNQPQTCEAAYTLKYGVGSGATGAIALSAGARSRSPGLPECTTFGTGFVQQFMAPTPGTPNGLAVADVDGDGKKDVLVATSSNSVAYLRNTGSGFTQMPAIPVMGNAGALVALDFNKDGKLDFATAHGFSGQVVVYAQGTGGSFSQLATQPLAQAVDLVTGDFNGDGNPDLAVSQGFNNQISVLLGNGTSGFLSTATVAVPDPRGLAVADLNGDTFPDLVAASFNMDTVRVFNGSASGVFAPGASIFVMPGSQPSHVAVADFDADGDKDIAATLSGSGQVAMIAQTSSSSYALAGTSPGPFNPGRVAAGDLNADGVPDLAVAGSGPGVWVMTSNGGMFMLAHQVGTSQTSAAGIADFDGDGATDLAVSESGSLTAKIFRQLRPVPTASDATFSFTAPANVGLMTLRRGAYGSATDWVYFGPAVSGANAVSLPLTSTLAPARSAPSGQSAMWQPALFLNQGSAPINRDNMNVRLIRYESAIYSGAVRYVRQ